MTAAKIRGVYGIVHTATNYAYIGCSADVSARWAWHLQHLATRKHHSRALQAAWLEHGRKGFKFVLLELVADRQNLRPREEAWMRVYAGRLFNAMPENRHGAESRLAMSRSQEAAWEQRYAEGRDRLTIETRAEISRATRRWARQPRVRARKSEIARETDAAANFRSPEAIAKNAAALRGTPKSASHRAAMKLTHSSGLCKCHPRKETQ